jgi:hypothetical protein
MTSGRFMSPKDRDRDDALGPGVRMRIERSSTHPVEYAILLLAFRDGGWRTVRTFDNAHAPDEHHEHRYRGAHKQPPIVTYGSVNVAMHAAEMKLRRSWPAIVQSWEETR